MPFTPFHFGPGAALKALAPRHVSLTIFCYSQIVTDLETGYYMVTNQYPLHGFVHSFPGATLVGVFCAVTGRPLCRLLLRAWQENMPEPLDGLFGSSTDISWGAAFLTAFLGTYSHVVLDSIMHRDMAPFGPYSAANPFLHLVGGGALELLCVAAGVLGVLVLVCRKKA